MQTLSCSANPVDNHVKHEVKTTEFPISAYVCQESKGCHMVSIQMSIIGTFAQKVSVQKSYSFSLQILFWMSGVKEGRGYLTLDQRVTDCICLRNRVCSCSLWEERKTCLQLNVYCQLSRRTSMDRI